MKKKCFKDLCYSEKIINGWYNQHFILAIYNHWVLTERNVVKCVHSPVSHCLFLFCLFLMQPLSRHLAQSGVGNVRLNLQNPFSSRLSSFPGPGPEALMTRWTHWSGFLGHFQGYQQPKPILFFSNLCVHVWGTEPTWKATFNLGVFLTVCIPR